DELIQEEDFADLDRNTLLSPYHTLIFEELESSLTAEDPLNMQLITRVQPYENLDENTLLSPYRTLMFEEADSPSTAEDLSNLQVITPVQPLTHVWTKAHPLDQVIGDPFSPVMTRSKLITDSKVCMYASTVSTIKPKNIKEAMSDHS
nr:hypothetical protein [Tanacetum cinerariifolium]